MNWFIATPSLPPAVAGPAQYAEGIAAELKRRGHVIRVVAYGALERALPPGLRHLVYALRLLPALMRSDIVLALDTWSVGFPALLLARLFRKKFMVRIGGDYLWESYVERTGKEILLSEFYLAPRPLSLKERLIRRLTKRLLTYADAVLFTTAWQRDIWHVAYRFNAARAHVLENVFPERDAEKLPRSRVFVAAGRPIRLKNLQRLKRVFKEIEKQYPDISLDTKALPPEEHRARVALSYALIVASHSEVNPNTLADAVRAGKPFIATRDTGALLRLSAIGAFIDTRDEKALARAIEELLDEKTYTAARERVRAFSYVRLWGDVVSDLEGIALAL